jgi:hypothetical protein
VAGLVLAVAVSSCAAPPRSVVTLGTSTEADVRAAFPRETFCTVQRQDGTALLVVFLRPRPAAPGGGSLSYVLDARGVVVARGPIVVLN